MLKQNRRNRIPVSTKDTFCVPFNIQQKARNGYKVSENPVKPTVEFTTTYEEALDKLRSCNIAGWRDYGQGNSQSARKAIGWVKIIDANRLLDESDDNKRVVLYESLTDVVD